ncbi:hypothetical protein SAMN05216371_4509 [Streptomyces sp. TLI_053]|uniref:hypothetical protein n=1 Tax=Streptomyces sp. TLI_053 TaxID=1855352 RepID=UPI00087A98B9|nr:hypothetical protein [Streptomyces sp. TLI_053]SDT73533.1 hypothetical protein SAMN05216371_4509 [Streptomyces sp. TLI_053]
MNSTRMRRVLGSAAATAVAALSVGTLAVPAHAAGPALSIEVGSLIQVPGEPTAQPQFGENVFLRVGRTGTAPVPGAKLTLDTTGLDGVATLTASGGRCATAARTVTCDLSYLNSDSINITDHLWLSAVPGVRAGTRGVVHAALTAPGAESANKDFSVEVGGAAFRVAEIAPKEQAKVGTTFTPAVRFANRGGVSAARAVVEVMMLPGLKVENWPSNCEYATDPGRLGQEGFGTPIATTHAICTVEGEILPNEPVRLKGVDLTVTSEARYTFADFMVFADPDAAAAQGPALRRRLAFEHGTGAPATLVRDSAEGIPSGYPDINGHFTEQEVLADNGADFALTGTWAPDASGRSGTLTVTAANRGPASIYDRSGGDGTPFVRIQLPEGATVTDLPKNCRADNRVQGQPTDRLLNRYSCDAFSFFMANGASSRHVLGVQLDDGTVPLSATVSFQNQFSDFEEGYPSAPMSWDPDPDNDRIKVALRSLPATVPTGPDAGTGAPAEQVAPVVPASAADATGSGTGTGTAAGTATTTGRSAARTGSTGTTDTVALGLADGGELADSGRRDAVPLAWASATALTLGGAALLTSRRLGRRRP